MVQAVELVAQVAPPGVAVAVKEVIAEPPVSEGVVQDTVARPSSAVALTDVGLDGTVIGVADAEAWEGSLVPTMLVAVTVTV